MAYKISGMTTDNSRAHIIKDGIYIGYKDVVAGGYDLIFNADDNANVMTVSEKTNGHTVGYGGITAIPTIDGANLTLPSGGATLKSIQTAVIQIADGTTTDNVTISAVDPSKTILIRTGQSYPGSSFEHWSAITSLTSSTNIYGVRSNGVGNLNISMQVIEFESGVNVQRGEVWALYTSTLSQAVTVANSMINTTGAWYWAIGGGGLPTSISLTNTTTLTPVGGWSNGSSAGVKVGWEVIEFL